MPLFVRGEEIADMTVELQGLLKSPTKTEALRQALRHGLERVRATVPVKGRLARARAMADALGPSIRLSTRKRSLTISGAKLGRFYETGLP